MARKDIQEPVFGKTIIFFAHTNAGKELPATGWRFQNGGKILRGPMR